MVELAQLHVESRRLLGVLASQADPGLGRTRKWISCAAPRAVRFLSGLVDLGLLARSRVGTKGTAYTITSRGLELVRGTNWMPERATP